ncbi:MAG: hypothetical protein IPL19_21610, partial [Sandaracinaceae bacterium]|nr:hypothetical protein [Sandaracinaceae bacterium]
MTTTLATEPATCSVCQQPAQCLVVTIADEAGDMRRSVLTLRTMVAAVCRRCMDAARVPRTFARSRFHECPVTKRGESRPDEPGWYSD